MRKPSSKQISKLPCQFKKRSVKLARNERNTFVMLQELYGSREAQENFDRYKPDHLVRLKKIWERLVVKRQPWTPADLMWVKEMYELYAIGKLGKRSKPKGSF